MKQTSFGKEIDTSNIVGNNEKVTDQKLKELQASPDANGECHLIMGETETDAIPSPSTSTAAEGTPNFTPPSLNYLVDFKLEDNDKEMGNKHLEDRSDRSERTQVITDDAIREYNLRSK